MEPVEAIVTIRRERREFEGWGADGNTPNVRVLTDYEKVPAKVWPVAMGEGCLLVEFDDGRLRGVNLWDIEIVREDGRD